MTSLDTAGALVDVMDSDITTDEVDVIALEDIK